MLHIKHIWKSRYSLTKVVKKVQNTPELQFRRQVECPTDIIPTTNNTEMFRWWFFGLWHHAVLQVDTIISEDHASSIQSEVSEVMARSYWQSVMDAGMFLQNYLMFRAQAGWTLTHTSHKHTEQSTTEASVTLDGVTLTDSLSSWSPNEWPSVCWEIPESADKMFWMSNKPAQWTLYTWHYSPKTPQSKFSLLWKSKILYSIEMWLLESLL
jgi:hypothetical protein